MRAAAGAFETVSKVGDPTAGRTGAVIERVVGPLRTTVVLLEEGSVRVCLVASPFSTDEETISERIRERIAERAGMAAENVLVFSSHDHCVPLLVRSAHSTWSQITEKRDQGDLLPLGRRFLDDAVRTAGRLASELREVTVHYGLGREDRITYNRKGRRADGSTYFMREEDRRLVGKDFRGDIDTDAPVVCLKDSGGGIVLLLVQFTGHPVTAYHPEQSVAFGEWPQVAAEVLAQRFCGSVGEPPVAFLQGCCGDVNSKEMCCGGVARSMQFGRYLGRSYVQAAKRLVRSQRHDMGFAMRTVQVPLGQLASQRALERDLEEIRDFVRRASAGDPHTLTCVGLNFPRALSPRYRAALVEMISPWYRWALRQRRTGKAEKAARSLAMEMAVLRLGDVGVVGIPGEPFQGIGRQIKRGSPTALTIPCGYMNRSFGYITDGPNTGDREYMSSFYRYTRFLPPYRKPAGDALAKEAVRTLKQLSKG